MAAGTFPTGTLSVIDIDVCAFGRCAEGSLQYMGNNSSLSLPVSVNDFKGCDYCQISPDNTTVAGNINCKLNDTVSVTLIPDVADMAVLSEPYWTYICIDDANNTINIQACSSGAPRSGDLCIYDISGNDFTTGVITICQYST
jgi:hypothetical protein